MILHGEIIPKEKLIYLGQFWPLELHLSLEIWRKWFESPRRDARPLCPLLSKHSTGLPPSLRRALFITWQILQHLQVTRAENTHMHTLTHTLAHTRTAAAYARAAHLCQLSGVVRGNNKVNVPELKVVYAARIKWLWLMGRAMANARTKWVGGQTRTGARQRRD